MKVFVYYNLHKHLWSVKALEGENKGRVIAHREFVLLANAEPKVSEAGRQRVLKEKRKNVHAGIVGEWKAEHKVEFYFNFFDLESSHITYNPYKYDTFVYAHGTHDRWMGSPVVMMSAFDKPSVSVYDDVPF